MRKKILLATLAFLFGTLIAWAGGTPSLPLNYQARIINGKFHVVRMLASPDPAPQGTFINSRGLRVDGAGTLYAISPAMAASPTIINSILGVAVDANGYLIVSVSGGSSMTWPSGGAGIPNYNGSSAWGTSYSASNPIPFNFLATTVAKTDLSNLASPTAINQSLLFATDNTYDIGSASKEVRNIYFGGSLIGGGSLVNITGPPGSCPASGSGLGELCFSSTGNRPIYGYNAGTPANLLLQTDTISRIYTAGTGGVTANTLVKLDIDGTVIAVTGTESILGIAETTALAAAPVVIDIIGPSSCVAEGSVIQGDYLIAGTSTHDYCKDSGQSALSLLSVSSRIAGKATANGTDGNPVTLSLIGAYRFGAQVQTVDLPVLKANSVAATQCPTCVFGLDASVIGGIIGAYTGTTSAGTGFAFGGNGSGSTAAPIPMNMEIGGVTATLGAAMSSTCGSSWQIGLTYYNGATAITEPFNSVFIGQGAASGAYQGTYQPRIFQKGSFGSFGAGANTVASCALAALRNVTANVLGTTSQPLFVGLNKNTVAGSATVYTGPNQLASTTTNTTENLVATVQPYTATARNLCIATGGAQPAGGTLAVTLRTNGSTSTALTVAVPASGGAQTFCDITDSVTLTASALSPDWWDWQIVNGSGSTSATIQGISMEITSPGGGPTGLIIFGTGTSTIASGSNNFFPAFAGATPTSTEITWAAGVPRAFTAKNLSCYVTTAPGTSTANAFLRDNTSSSTLTVGITTGFSAPGIIQDTTHSVSVANKDLIDLLFNQASGTNVAVSSCSMEVD